MKFNIALTGPDWEPTEVTKWYAELRLETHDQIHFGLKTYAFGRTPEEAMTELAKYLRVAGVEF